MVIYVKRFCAVLEYKHRKTQWRQEQFLRLPQRLYMCRIESKTQPSALIAPRLNSKQFELGFSRLILLFCINKCQTPMERNRC